MEPTLLPALMTMGGLGVLFAGGLAFADRKLRVEEDPRIGEIASQLPNANCGACGLAGCQDFAVKVVAGEVAVTGCPVGGPDVAADIARILGVEPGESVRLVARVLCRGGAGIATVKADYVGPSTCSAVALVGGGSKACLYGCIGGGECVDACQFDAMFLDEQGLPHVIEELCTGCGACARACPRDVIELHPDDREIFVFCRNHDDPKTAKKVCAVACLGCGVCSKKSNGGVTMREHLAIIDYERLEPGLIPFDKCRPGSIRYLNQSAAPAADASSGTGAGA